MNVAESSKVFPPLPGVYLFKDRLGHMLYVGKANVLRNRIRSYFLPATSERISKMVAQAASLEFIVTASPYEALILESNLVQEHDPKYNIRLKGSDTYPYIKVTVAETFPRLLKTRNLSDKQARYFGPYTDSGSVQLLLELLQKITPYRTCRLKIELDGEGKGVTVPKSALPGGRPCLLYHIKRCPAPCVGLVSPEEYRKTIDLLMLMLDGRSNQVSTALKTEMEEAAERLDFEKAARVRDRLQLLEKLHQHQSVHTAGGGDQDVLAAVVGSEQACVQLLVVREGKLVGREKFLLENPIGASAADLVEKVIQQHYRLVHQIPRQLTVLEELPNQEVLVRLLTERSGKDVKIVRVQKGKNRKLLEMAQQNATETLHSLELARATGRGNPLQILEVLQKQLKLEAVPLRIEGYDVSHLQGNDVVVSMVVFESGVPKKSEYRRFKMAAGNDDVTNIRNALARRLKHLSGPARWKQPDLLLIDGGKPQLAAAQSALAEAGKLEIPLVALAKKQEELFLPGQAEALQLGQTPGRFLLERVRDEAHRFAGSYHKLLRSRRIRASVLDDIAGVGAVRKRKLLAAFGSPAAIVAADPDSVAALLTITRGKAEAIQTKIRAIL